MATKQVQSIDIKGVSVDDYVPALLDAIEVPKDKTVSTVILGNDHGSYSMLVHFEPLTDAQFADEGQWLDAADVVAVIYPSFIRRIIRLVQRRWPEAQIFNIPGCLCCNGVEDLREYNCQIS